MKSVNLEEVLAYENADIPARFVKMYGVSDEVANVLFNDLKRWLWLAQKPRSENKDKPFMIDQPIVVIDAMWHNFVLFTREYIEFCQTFFGRYLHHAPFTKSESEAMSTELESLSGEDRVKHILDQKRWQYEYIYDTFGEETFIRWYKQYPKEYSAIALAKKYNDAEQARYNHKLKLINEHKNKMKKTG